MNPGSRAEGNYIYQDLQGSTTRPSYDMEGFVFDFLNPPNSVFYIGRKTPKYYRAVEMAITNREEHDTRIWNSMHPKKRKIKDEPDQEPNHGSAPDERKQRKKKKK